MSEGAVEATDEVDAGSLSERGATPAPAMALPWKRSEVASVSLLGREQAKCGTARKAKQKEAAADSEQMSS